jgi:hypothetical protein
VFRALRDDRPSTGPLGRSEKAALVSGSSSVLLGRRRRVSVGWVADSRGAAAVPRGGVAVSRGAAAVPRGGVAVSRGAAAVLIGWLVLAAARTGCVAPADGGFMLWAGRVAA